MTSAFVQNDDKYNMPQATFDNLLAAGLSVGLGDSQRPWGQSSSAVL